MELTRTRRIPRNIIAFGCALALAVTLTACASPVPEPPTVSSTVTRSATPTSALTQPSARTPPLTIVATVALGPPPSWRQAPESEAVPLIEHTVQPGETLSTLATEYGIPIAAIQLQNDLGASTIVQAGQVLAIPPTDVWEGASTYWAVYEVAPGDTLSEIAATYDLDITTLRVVNGMASTDLLIVGQPLVLPLTVPVEVAVRVPPPTIAPLPTLTSVLVTPVAAATSIPATPAPLPADVTAWPREVWRIMNAVRAEHGLPPYTYNDALAQAAQLHAEDCQQRQSCGHTGSDGSTIKIRILRAGYDPASWSECWAVRPSPQGVIDIWLDEVPPDDAHRRTVLHTWFTEVGVGVSESPWEGTYYVIADFGRPK